MSISQASWLRILKAVVRFAVFALQYYTAEQRTLRASQKAIRNAKQ